MDTWPRFITDWRFHLFFFGKKQPFLEWWSSTFFSGGCNHPPELKDNWILGYPIFTQTNLGIIQNLVPKYEMIGRNPEKNNMDRNHGFAIVFYVLGVAKRTHINDQIWPKLTQMGQGERLSFFLPFGLLKCLHHLKIWDWCKIRDNRKQMLIGQWPHPLADTIGT